MKKAQGLPMQTIAIIIIVILVLVGVLLFFFGAFGESGGVASEQAATAECQTRCVQLNVKYGSGVDGVTDLNKFCEPITISGETRHCDEFVACEINSEEQVVTCNGDDAEWV